jgi:thiamine transporter
LDISKIKGGIIVEKVLNYLDQAIRFDKIKLETFYVLGAIVGLSIIALLVGKVISNVMESRGKRMKFDTRMLVYGGICIALSFVLSYIRLYKMPQGGSITAASMLPLIIYAYFFGPTAGITAGVAYGFLQFFQDNWVVHWAQVILDYPLAFGMIGLAGLSRKNLTLAVLIGGTGRFVMHFISGLIFFADAAPEGVGAVYYSLTYNLTSIGVDTLICVVIAMLPQLKTAVKKVKQGVV